MPYLPLSSPLWQSQPSGHLSFARLSISKLPLIEYHCHFFLLLNSVPDLHNDCCSDERCCPKISDWMRYIIEKTFCQLPPNRCRAFFADAASFSAFSIVLWAWFWESDQSFGLSSQMTALQLNCKVNFSFFIPKPHYPTPKTILLL